MVVYRIAKSVTRTQDFSGMGAFKNGGRWNSKGTYMLYTSVNSSLAYLETLVHFDEFDTPPALYITAIEINIDPSINESIYQLPDTEYPVSWQLHENLENKIMGNKWMFEKKFLAIKVRSAVNPSEYNFLLNPLFPGYHDKIKLQYIEPLNIDTRLVR
jgi:RES domain-containing protein